MGPTLQPIWFQLTAGGQAQLTPCLTGPHRMQALSLLWSSAWKTPIPSTHCSRAPPISNCLWCSVGAAFPEMKSTTSTLFPYLQLWYFLEVETAHRMETTDSWLSCPLTTFLLCWFARWKYKRIFLKCLLRCTVFIYFQVSFEHFLCVRSSFRPWI